ncbi:response regulator transcription factor [Microbacterium sp. B19]|uniref:response regulator n=1 Tax=Microbacterium sp. B19 TaxID=96765 RepID=UPI0003B3D0FD|nr:response regulator transcription factor [Microbacterium sp. B19]
MTDGHAIRVLIVDDNRTFRRGVRLRLDHVDDVVVVGEAATGADAVTAALSERPDVILMDLEIPGMNGLDATRAVIEDSDGRVRVIALTSHGEDHLVRRALSNGASGYLLKTHDGARLVDAIRSVHRGEGIVSTRVTPALLADVVQRRITDEDRGKVASLSPSELAVVRLLSDGITSNEHVAKQLGVSVNTVRTHIHAALRKVGVADRTQLALWGVRVREELVPRDGIR